MNSTQHLNGATKEIYVYRPGLPERPKFIQSLPLNSKGYPIPYFVSYIDGVPDFRVIDPVKFFRCVRFQLCWICGQKLGRYHSYVGGPMSMLNRVSGEPPSHNECASYAVRSCPFMLLPKTKRREAGMPEEVNTLAGVMLLKNPGVTAVWTTEEPMMVEQSGEGILFHLPKAVGVSWYREGRLATRAECEEGITVGLPEVQKLASEAGEQALLDERLKELYLLLPEGQE